MACLLVLVLQPTPDVAAEATSSAALRLSPEMPVTAVDLSAERANNSPTLAVDPTDQRFIALASRVDAPKFDCLLHVSGDRGRSWLPARPVSELPSGADACYAPEVAFDQKGVLYYLFIGLKGAANVPMGVFLTSSADRRVFSSLRQVLGPHRYMVRMAIDTTVGKRGRIHLVWLEANSPPPLAGLPAPPNPILAAHSDDGGKTFSTPVPVSDPERRLVVAPSLAIGSRGAVHVAYLDLEDDVRDYYGLEGPTWEGTWSLVVSSSSDAGRSFGTHRLVADGLSPPQRVMLIFTMPPPSLVADKAGKVFTAWWDARNGDWDVFVARSVDVGRAWGKPVRLNDDPVGNGRHQYLPRLSLAPNGRLDAIFYDRRDDPANANHHVYYTHSFDGLRYAPSRRITSDPSHAETGARYPVRSASGLVELGSRLGLVSQQATAVAAWPDTRDVVLKNTQQDIFSRRVTLSESPDPPRPAAQPDALRVYGLVAAGLAVVGVLVGTARGRRRPRRRSPRSAPGAAEAVGSDV